MRGTDVWALQVFLSIDGAGLASVRLASFGPTGNFGLVTEAALAEYQKSVGISPSSGYFGPQTRTVIEGGTVSVMPIPTTSTPPPPSSSPIEPPSLSYGSEGSEVAALQKILVNDGYLSPGIFTPSTFDIPTERAIEVFQCLQKIICSGSGYGTVGLKTRTALGM